MRILQVVPAFYPSKSYGGAPNVVYEISKRLSRRGHEVIVYTTDAYDSNGRITKTFDEIEGIKVRYFRNLSNSLAYNHKLFTPIGALSAVRKEMEKIDVVHMHDYRTILNAMVYKYSLKYGVPYIIQPHGAAPRILQKQKLKVFFDVLVGYSMLSNASKIFALNKSEASKILAMDVSPNKIEIVPNGIDLNRYFPLPKKETFRRKYGILERKIILYLGRIHVSKGIDLLIESFPEVLKQTDDVRLVIVGPDDGFLDYLKKLAKSLSVESKVLFTGPVSEYDKLAAYVDADVFVTPSFYGFPLTFLEAMACGTPIITTNRGDFISGIHGNVGFVTEYNKDDLARAISLLLDKEGLRRKFSKNSKRTVTEFNWDRVVDRIEKSYNELLEGENS